MKQTLSFLWIFCLCSGAAFAQRDTNVFNQPPEWSKHAIWYQIFVERFYNGDKSNDPAPKNISMPPLGMMAPEGWAVTPWTSDFFSRELWSQNTGQPFIEMLMYRRYGGDLQGVIDKLDYLMNLGITALFMNPLNDAPSLHKYDARNYHHIDVNFGPDPASDNRLIARENPADPATWQWTSADKLFLQLIREAHKRHLRVIMDYSWNHTGVMFWAWQDILKNQEKSPYKDWYAITSFDDPDTPANEFSYRGWAGGAQSAELKKVEITTTRINGYPYEGDINDGARTFADSLLYQWNRLPASILPSMMSVSSSHDTPRLLTDFYNPNRYKFHCIPNDDPGYKTGKPDEETWQRLCLYLAYEFTTIGAPHIWNGEEMGMWGADDPYCRKPLWWKEFDFDDETRNNFQPGEKQYDPVRFSQDKFDWYRKLIRIRNENPVLATGDFKFILTQGKMLAYQRSGSGQHIEVYFNLEPTEERFDLAEKGTYLDLISGDQIKTDNLKLGPMSCLIAKKVD